MRGQGTSIDARSTAITKLPCTHAQRIIPPRSHKCLVSLFFYFIFTQKKFLLFIGLKTKSPVADSDRQPKT
ncbi:hypothetical protein L1987_14634 [Smallanthus sonchifolius]|uniref:Uncharacterized protein n=1 Tax=Smallanthus sonchifolius TaxID=185202 RepID=A0ACB9J470_9ASTR|nr:hypothetical protein L1987_14634 [Smallanthus sonchifolius]